LYWGHVLLFTTVHLRLRKQSSISQTGADVRTRLQAPSAGLRLRPAPDSAQRGTGVARARRAPLLRRVHPGRTVPWRGSLPPLAPGPAAAGATAAWARRQRLRASDPAPRATIAQQGARMEQRWRAAPARLARAPAGQPRCVRVSVRSARTALAALQRQFPAQPLDSGVRLAHPRPRPPSAQLEALASLHGHRCTRAPRATAPALSCEAGTAPLAARHLPARSALRATAAQAWARPCRAAPPADGAPLAPPTRRPPRAFSATRGATD
jgi:hypothetical protein